MVKSNQNFAGARLLLFFFFIEIGLIMTPARDTISGLLIFLVALVTFHSLPIAPSMALSYWALDVYG